MNGIYLIDKPRGITSRDAVNHVSRILGTKKVGHAGTLDPFATGLLLIAVGRATKILPFLNDFPKTYEADLVLGATTSSLDPETPIVKTIKTEQHYLKTEINDALNSFLGEITQIPPMTSAIKINGVPAYKRFRAGEQVEMKPRKVVIYHLDLLEITQTGFRFRAVCSSGTYIRTLGADIARKLNTIGYLCGLRRTDIGPWSVSMAKGPDDIKDTDGIDIKSALIHLPNFNLSGDEEIMVHNGRALFWPHQDELILLSDHEGQPMAVYGWDETKKAYISRRGLH